MQDEKRDDEVVDDMPAPAAAPCGQIFEAEAEYVTDADDDMPAPEGRCGDQFGGSQTIHVTDADGV
jgi:hypothetical protein